MVVCVVLRFVDVFFWKSHFYFYFLFVSVVHSNANVQLVGLIDTVSFLVYEKKMVVDLV